MSDISELLEKVKAATGPDREIDGAVFAACGYPVNPKNSEYVKYPDANETTYSLSPHLSASIDAALSLVERVHPWKPWVDMSGMADREDGENGPLWSVSFDGMPPLKARQLPLAILAALLSALEPQP